MENPDHSPITNFSQCHVGILSNLEALQGLPELSEAADRARAVASSVLSFFSDAVYQHHAEEERALFTAVLASAAKGEEFERVQSMVARLTAEHRRIEARWSQLEPHLRKVAKGQKGELGAGDVDVLVREYGAHAAFEEQEFLPLSERILRRNSDHMAALGLSLHMRQVPTIVPYL